MSKYTTRIYDIMRSELYKSGFDDVYHNGQFLLGGEDQHVIQKIIKLDKDAIEILNNVIFKGFTLEDPEVDYTFKKLFITRFQGRQINRQTLESFSSILIYTCLSMKDQLELIIGSIKDFINGADKTITDRAGTDIRHSTGVNINDYRNGFANLPQDDISFDVNNAEMETADNFTKTHNTDNSTNDDKLDKGEHIETTQDFHDIDKLIESINYVEEMFKIIDKKCFLQIR